MDADETRKRIKELRERDGNNLCADCGAESECYCVL